MKKKKFLKRVFGMVG